LNPGDMIELAPHTNPNMTLLFYTYIYGILSTLLDYFSQ